MFQIYKEYPRRIWALAIAAIIFSTGMALIWPLIMIYIHDHLGKSMTTAGILLLVNQGAFLVGSLTGGVMFDRWGKLRTVIFASCGAVVVAVAMGIWQSFLIYSFLLFFNGFFSGIMFPVINALASLFWNSGGRKGMNLIYVAINIGVAIGSALAGILASVSFSLTFFGNGIAQAIVLFLFIAMISQYQRAGQQEDLPKAVQTQRDEVPVKPTNGNARIALILLCSGLIICWIVYVQWQTVIASYMQSLGISLAHYSLLWTLNGALILFAQPLISWVIKHFARTIKAQIMLGAYVYSLTMLLLSQTTSYSGFVIAMFIMTLGEMLVWPGVPTLAAELAPSGQEGRYQGMVSGAGSAGRMLGPLLGALLYEAFSPSWMFSIMAVFTLMSVGCFAFYTRFRLAHMSTQNVKVEKQTM